MKTVSHAYMWKSFPGEGPARKRGPKVGACIVSLGKKQQLGG